MEKVEAEVEEEREVEEEVELFDLIKFRLFSRT